jgi:hypothetical protein
MNSSVATGHCSYCRRRLLFCSGRSSAAAASSIGSTTTAGLHRLPSPGTGPTGGTGLHCPCIKQLLCHRHFLLNWIRIDSICCHHRADFIRCSIRHRQCSATSTDQSIQLGSDQVLWLGLAQSPRLNSCVTSARFSRSGSAPVRLRLGLVRLGSV